MTRLSLEDTWRVIEGEGKINSLGALRLLPAGVSTPFGDVLVGVDSHGRRHLLAPTAPTELGREDKRSRGVTIEVRRLLQGVVETPYLDCCCVVPELNRLFSLVAGDMLTALGRRGADGSFVECHLVLERWRELLEPSRSSLMTSEAQAALFAELSLLERLVSVEPKALNGWVGPTSAPRDFVCGRSEFEVKSTLSSHSEQIEVNGHRQLEPSESNMLYLVFMRLLQNPGRGRSVPDLVGGILEKGAEAAKFIQGLGRHGYRYDDAEAYRQTTFEVVEERMYPVGSDFGAMRLDSFSDSMLPDAVVRLQYTLDLGRVGSQPLSRSTAVETIVRAGEAFR